MSIRYSTQRTAGYVIRMSGGVRDNKERSMAVRRFVGLVALTAATLAGCGGGGSNTPALQSSDSGGAANACPNASNSFGYYPSADVCSYYKMMSFMVPYTGTINLTAFYLDSGTKYPAGTHNGIDFQTADVAGKKCQTTQNCTEHDVVAPIEAKVVAKNATYGAVVLEFLKPVNGTNQRFDYAVLHLKPGSFDHLTEGHWVPMGKRLGTQWNTSSVNGTSNDFSAHVHLEFSVADTNRVLTQRSDANALAPSDFLSWVNGNIDLVASKKSAMAVSTVTVTGQSIAGQTVTIRATGSNFPPSAFLGIWTADAAQDQSVATCDLEGFSRGTSNGIDHVEQRCTLNRVGNFELFVKAKSGESTIRTQPISVASATAPACAGLWTQRLYTTNQVETGADSCPSGQSGSISKAHTCQADGSWGRITTTSACAAVLLPPTAVKVSRGAGYIDVSWTGSVGATGYDVWREISPNQPVAYATAAGTTYRDSSVVSGNQYCYYISAMREFAGGYEATGHPAYECVVAQ